MGIRDTLEIGDRDMHVTWVNDVSSPENSCSHTYEAFSFFLDCDIAYRI